MNAVTYTKTGAKATKPVELSKDTFGLEIKSHDLVRQTYEAYLADNRMTTSATKTRGLIRGGGRKPWRQKGTGRARFGSIRTPLWRGGGTVFGPTGLENHKLDLNKKSKQKALKEALTIKADSKAVIVINELPDTGKTADLSKLIAKIDAKADVLVVTDKMTEMDYRSSKNLQSVKMISSDYLNVYHLLNADIVAFTPQGLDALYARTEAK